MRPAWTTWWATYLFPNAPLVHDILGAAAALGDIDLFEQHSNVDEDVLAESPLFGSPIEAAALTGQVEFLEYIRDRLWHIHRRCTHQTRAHVLTGSCRTTLAKLGFAIEVAIDEWQSQAVDVLINVMTSLFHDSEKTRDADWVSKAMASGCVRTLEVVLSNGIEDAIRHVEDNDWRAKDIQRGFEAACSAGHIDMIQYVLRSQLFPSISTPGYDAGLGIAMEHGQLGVMEILLEHTAMRSAELFQRVLKAPDGFKYGMVQLLLRHGVIADVNTLYAIEDYASWINERQDYTKPQATVDEMKTLLVISCELLKHVPLRFHALTADLDSLFAQLGHTFMVIPENDSRYSELQRLMDEQ